MSRASLDPVASRPESRVSIALCAAPAAMTRTAARRSASSGAERTTPPSARRRPRDRRPAAPPGRPRWSRKARIPETARRRSATARAAPMPQPKARRATSSVWPPKKPSSIATVSKVHRNSRLATAKVKASNPAASKAAAGRVRVAPRARRRGNAVRQVSRAAAPGRHRGQHREHRHPVERDQHG